MQIWTHDLKRRLHIFAVSGCYPPELHEAFDDFLSEYRFAALTHHGGPYVSAVVIGELVLAGWRRSAPPLAAIDAGIK